MLKKTVQSISIVSILALSAFGESGDTSFSAPMSVEGDLAENKKDSGSLLRIKAIDDFFAPYGKWKESINKEYNIDFGGDYQALYLNTDESLTNDNAFSGMFRLYLNYKLYNQDSVDSGSLIFKIENRHTLNSDVSALDYGFAAGYYGIPGTMFGEYAEDGWGVTNFFWKQRFNNANGSFWVGKMDPTDYLGVYGLMNPLTAFSNLAFSSDQSMFLPNQGLGVAVASMINDNFYVIGGLNDANGDAREDGFDTFFNDADYFSSIELGWTTNKDRIYFDNFHVTLWHVDEHSKFNASSEGWGVNFSAAYFINDAVMPFLRGGYSEDGAALMAKNLSAGVGYYMNDTSDLVGIGVNWSEPSDNTLKEQFTTEAFYRFQIAKSLAITPSIQYIKDPALHSTEDTMTMFGLRTRITF